MTTEHAFTALRAHERTTAALMADPQIVGDLLLVGLWLSRAIHLRTPAPTDDGSWHLVDMARDVFPFVTRPAMFANGEYTHIQETGPDTWRVFGALKADIRRYDVWLDHPGGRGSFTPCGGPMIRRDVCGKRSVIGQFLTDPTTGRKAMIGACSRHQDWYRGQCRDNRAALEGVEVPRPPANAGGCLARHIDIDWEALWLGLDREWTAPPELDSWVRPKLKLLTGDLDARPVVKPRAPRPRFGVINGVMSPESEPVLS